MTFFRHRQYPVAGKVLAWDQPCSGSAQNKQPKTQDNNDSNQKGDDNNHEIAIDMRGMTRGGEVSEFV
jgi:hypothetical protein